MIVVDKVGVRGRMLSREQSSGSLSQVLVSLPSGETIKIPDSDLRPVGPDLFSLPVRFADLLREQTSQRDQEDSVTIPIVEEVLDVQRRRVERGVRIRKTTAQHTEVIDASSVEADVSVERVAVNRVISEPLPIRDEGDTIIIPVMVETIVCEKRLVLREEIRVTVHRREEHQPKEVTLRREEVVVEPIDSKINPGP